MSKPPLRRIVCDRDTALEDDQWDKLVEFLSDKIDEEDMLTVEKICRGGGDAPEDKPTPGASDSAMQRVKQHRDKVRDQHRRGLISDAELPAALEYGKIKGSAPKAVGVVYDAKTFPHSSRLK